MPTAPIRHQASSQQVKTCAAMVSGPVQTQKRAHPWHIQQILTSKHAHKLQAGTRNLLTPTIPYVPGLIDGDYFLPVNSAMHAKTMHMT